MTLRAIITDDEPLALNLLSAILADIDGVEIVAQCASGAEAIHAIQEHAPDIIFLDIQMPEINGFDVIAAIQSDIMPLVVFTTAYAEYAVEAFKVRAIDYVLKPLEESSLRESIGRARAMIAKGQQSAQKPNLLSALDEISDHVNEHSGREHSKKLAVKETDRLAILDQRNIDWIEAAGDYVCIHSGGATRIMRATLKAIEEQLSQAQFQRIHRSTLVNIDSVHEVIAAPKGAAFVKMRDDSQLKASRRYGAILKQRLT